MPAMKGGVEACHLNEVGPAPVDGLDGCQIVGLMQGGQRDQAFQLADDLFRDAHRSIVGWAAVDDAVADNGRWRKKASQPSVEPFDCGARIGDLLPTVGLVDQDGVSTVAGNQTRLRADALELAAQAPIHFIGASHLEELELDAG